MGSKTVFVFVLAHTVDDFCSFQGNQSSENVIKIMYFPSLGCFSGHTVATAPKYLGLDQLTYKDSFFCKNKITDLTDFSRVDPLKYNNT